MADKRLPELTELTTLATGDKTHIVDVSDTTDHATGTSKFFSISTLSSHLASLAQTLTNKTLTLPIISSISNSGTITLPTGTDTLVGKATTDTLTNKTMTTAGNTFDSASATAEGMIELATIAEIDTGTDTTRAVTSDGLQGSFRNLRFMLIPLIESSTSVSTDTTIGGDWTVPFTGTIIQDDNNKDYFAAYTDTAGTTGTMVVDVHLNGTTIMATNKLDIETAEKDTTTAATQPDLTTTAVTAGDILTFDIDSIHSGTAALGLKVLIAIRPD